MFSYWGKAHIKGNAEVVYHPLIYHNLDVAAVGSVFLQHDKKLRKRLTSCSGLDEGILKALTTFFLALHDIGKFSEGFQNLNPPGLFQKLHGRLSNKDYFKKHDNLGYLLLKEIISEGMKQQWLKFGAQEDEAEEWFDLLSPWYRAVTGHHGKPPEEGDYFSSIEDYYNPKSITDALCFAEDISKFLLPSKPAPLLQISNFDEQEKNYNLLAWPLSGLAVLSDWIGSDRNSFPYLTKKLPLSSYWEKYALPQAEKAVIESGVLPSSPSPKTGLKGLFPEIDNPTPMQDHVAGCSLSDKPQLFIIEDITGSGKTEAALILAHRLILNNLSTGLFIALPTMATANAMYNRLSKAYGRIFKKSENPSLTLAHSSSSMSDPFIGSIELKNLKDTNYNKEDSASGYCSAWLADNRKKALLAAAGVGTIDQALLAVLPAKHQSLRLFGLGRNVLIVDEVHAYDTYMNKLLCSLLEFHAAQGGSAIMLSATLPMKTRKEFVNSFYRGLGTNAQELNNNSFPLVTHISSNFVHETPIESKNEATRTVNIEFAFSEDDIVERLVSTAQKGKCICWIRNTVGDALAAYEKLLMKDFPGEQIILFHARFTMTDRSRIEKKVLRLFGKESTAKERAGKILIATQVAEQSLDLDFDLMASDLPPIDLLIQRCGRIHRHVRNKNGDRIIGNKDERGMPNMVIFSPPVDSPDKDWYESLFPKAAYVYKHHGLLWQGAELVLKKGRITMPKDARQLIEGVYGCDVLESLPPVFLPQENRVEGEELGAASQGRLNTLNITDGYQTTHTHWLDDAETPTRLGERSTTLRIARWDSEKLSPWAGNTTHAWQKSDINVSRFWVTKEAPVKDPLLKNEIEQAKDNMPDKGKWCIIVPMQLSKDNIWEGFALNEKEEKVFLSYHQDTGLTYKLFEE